MSKTLYMVAKVGKQLAIATGEGKQVLLGGIEGLYGFMPVYEDVDDALDASEGGEYEIIELKMR